MRVYCKLIAGGIHPEHTRYQGTALPHEAGYDSLLTAENFIKQAIELPDARRSVPRYENSTGKNLFASLTVDNYSFGSG